MRYEEGDHVRIGFGKIDWVVHAEHMVLGSQYLILISPMSGRRNGQFARDVHLVRRGSPSARRF